jgi:hypothetical protein
MKTLVGTLLAVSIFVSVALAFDSQYKTRLITSATLTIHVKDGQYIVIRNFTQDQAASQRGVLVAGVIPSTPTPTATPTPTPTSTPASAGLTATKAHSPAGIVTFPNPWTWTIHVANGGNTATTFNLFDNILTDNLPNNSINYDQPSVTGTNSAQISCDITNSDLTCSASNTITFNPGDSFDVSFTASPNATGSYANPRASGVCLVKPSNNTCADTVVSNTNIPSPTPTPIFAPVLVATVLHPIATVNGGPTPRPTGEYIKPIIVAGPATLTIDPVPPATLAVTYRKFLQPIQPTPTPTAGIVNVINGATVTPTPRSALSTGGSTRSSVTRESTFSDDDEIEWSTPSPTPTATPTPTASPRLRAETPTLTATPSVTPTPTP